MPSRINGIGTAYIGRRNEEKNPGRCERCGRDTALSDYETRVWFTLLFIPVIPLGRKQIFEQCPICTGHRVMGLDEWLSAKQGALESSVEQLQANPDDPETYIQSHSTMAALGKGEDAEKLATAMLQKFNDNPKVQFYIASWHEAGNRPEEADRCFQRAYELEPENPSYLRAIAIGRIEQGQLTEAKQLLQTIEPPSEGYEPLAFYMLAKAFQEQGDHEQALAQLKQLLAHNPELRKDKDFQKTIRLSEQATGQTQSLIPKSPLFLRRGVLLGTAAVVAIAAAVGIGQWVASSRTVHFVNGTAGPINLTIDERSTLTVPARGYTTATLSEGSHDGEVTSPTPLAQRFDFTIESSLFGRFFKTPAFVVDPTRTAAIMWEQTEYTEQRGGGSYDFKVRAGESFSSFPDVDYIFQEFPDEIRLSNRSGATKTRVSMLSRPPSEILMIMSPDKEVDELLGFAERALLGGDRDEMLFFVYLGLGRSNQQLSRCSGFLGKYLDTRPVDVQWHRMYQNAIQWRGNDRELPAYYDKALAEAPNNSDLLYLRGRLEGRTTASQKYFRQAIDSDQSNSFAWSALGYNQMVVGDFAAAKASLERALQISPDRKIELDARVFDARMALGEFADLERELRQLGAANSTDTAILARLIRVLVEVDKISDAEKALRQFRNQLTSLGPGAGPQSFDTMLSLELVLHYCRKQFDKIVDKVEQFQDQSNATSWLFYCYLNQGKIAEAEKLADGVAALSQGDRPYLCLALAAHSQGDPAKAAQWRQRMVASLDKGEAEAFLRDVLERAAQGKLQQSDIDNIAVEYAFKSIVLLELAFQQEQHRGELIALAEKLNFSRTAPYHFASQIIEQLRQSN